MMTPREIIEAWPRKIDFGRACGITKNPAQRAWDMHRRSVIPVKYWQSLVAEAKGIGRRDITLTTLAKAHALPAESATDREPAPEAAE